MRRSSCFMHAQTPRRLIAFTRSNSSATSSAASLGGAWMPALLNAASSRPKVETVCSTMAATSASSATLQRTAIALWPTATRSSVAKRTAVSLTSASATAAPASANALAVARPMPEAAPVMSATLFSKDMFMKEFLSHRQNANSFEVLLVADPLQPLHDLAVAVVFLDRDMRHRGCRGCAMPMLVTRRAPDDIAGPDLLLGFAPALRPADTGDHDQCLAARMCVPVASRARLERDQPSRDATGIGS